MENEYAGIPVIMCNKYPAKIYMNWGEPKKRCYPLSESILGKKYREERMVSFQVSVRVRRKKVNLQDELDDNKAQARRNTLSLFSSISMIATPIAKKIFHDIKHSTGKNNRVVVRTRRDTTMSTSNCYVLRGIALLMSLSE